MNKTDLIAKISDNTDLTKEQTAAALNAFTNIVTDALKAGEKVQIKGFGTFEVKERSARKGYLPAVGESVEIPAKKVPAFKPGKILKSEIDA